MQSAPQHPREPERLATLAELEILDTLEEAAYDDLTRLAAHICGAPIALVSLVDKDRQWFKSHFGLDARETSREYAFCAHAILQDEPLVIPDSDRDPRFFDNPLVTGAPHVKFYAGVPLRFGPGLPMGTLCVIDAESRQISDTQLQALQALGRQVESQFQLRSQIRHLQEADRHKAEFVSMVNHELRTPLTSIRGSLGLLAGGAAGPFPDGARKMIDIALTNSERLIRLVGDILDIEKIEAGKLDFKPEAIDLREVVSSVLEATRGFAAEHSVHIKLADDAVAAPAFGDHGRLTQVVTNLLSNAIKYSPPGGTATLDVQRRGDSVAVSVRDEGPGVPEGFRDRVFERFAQADSSSTRSVGGTGLGLAITKEIVERHGGTIGFTTDDNRGTTFTFEIPASEAS